MATIQITSKKKAMDILINSLFQADETLNKAKYDNGKYVWSGSQKDYIGKEIDDLNGSVKAAYVERRSDTDGPYCQVMCVSTH
jgi:hypothetical protein